MIRVVVSFVFWNTFMQAVQIRGVGSIWVEFGMVLEMLDQEL